MTTEQLTKETEQTNQSSETKEAETASKKEVQPSAKQTQETENKAYRSLQSSLDKLKAEITTLKTAKQSESKSQAIEAEAKRWTEEEDIPEGKVRKFSDAVKEYASNVTEHNAKIEEHEAKVQEFETKYSDTVNSKYLYDKAFPEASDVIKESLEKMADAKTDRERELLAEKLSVGLREQLIEALTKEDKEVKRPDSSRTSTSGGKRIFTKEEISDRDFWLAHKEEILKAEKEGRIK